MSRTPGGAVLTSEQLDVLRERYLSRSSTKRLVITDAVQVHKDVLSLLKRIEELEDAMFSIGWHQHDPSHMVSIHAGPVIPDIGLGAILLELNNRDEVKTAVSEKP